MFLKEKAFLWLSILFFLCYKLIFQLYFYFCRTFGRCPGPGELELSRILYRRKYAVGDLAGWTDFFCLREKITSIEDLKAEIEHWSLYTFTTTDVVLVRLPSPITSYQAAAAPFLYITQFLLAEKVARVPIEEFIAAFSGHRLENDLVIITMQPRSGSTLLGQILQLEGETLSFTEPDAFSSIAMLWEGGEWGEEMVDALLKAAINFFDIGVTVSDKRQTLVLKFHSVSTPLLPRIRALFPHSHALHTYRQRDSIIKSNERFLRGSNYCEEFLWIAKHVSMDLAAWLTPTLGAHKMRVKQFGAFTSWEFAMIYVLHPFKVYLKNRDHYTFPVIFLEDVIGPDAGSLARRVFSQLNLPIEKAEENLRRRLGIDSQEGSPYSQKSQQKIGYATLTEKDRERLDKLATLMDLSNPDRAAQEARANGPRH